MNDAQDWTAPSTRLLVMRRIQLALIATPTITTVGLLGAFIGSAGLGGLLALVIAAVVLAWERLLHHRIRAWAYAEREDDLLIRRGVMIRKLSVIPYGRMQFVDVTAGPVERMFGLATVRMHTAAAASDARIPGLLAAEAARLRDALAALGEAKAAGL
ncbi:MULTISPECIES: PH domain-containing protein [unclassified Frankia]|uniref:PH domain-containing protein n=1 Tax=unclassified Frankia TaxID=2632575 RepID=UPI001EF64D30|nr:MULTISPECIES: PH domain-containing protein [unclassified Frankia]